MDHSLLLADDHALIRAGVRMMVEHIDGFSVVGEAEDGSQAIAMAGKLNPDIVLLDITMKNVSGIDALQVFKRDSPHIKVLMLSMHSEADVVLDALQKGADGYLLKDATLDELPLALTAISRGNHYLSSAVMWPVIQQAVTRSKPDHELTQRQLEILRLIARCESTRSIALGLGLSVKTVEAHRAQIMKRLNIHDVAGLVLYAVRHGIVDIDD